MQKTLFSSWPLFFGLAMIMIGNGLQGTLLGVRANIEGFPTLTIGLIMSLYYAGFLAGSVYVPRLIQGVGHIRVFAALASLASATVLLHGIFTDPVSWSVVRAVTGFSYAGLYIVIESWLNQAATNENRGKVMALYLIILYAGMAAGQFLMNIADPAQIELFVLTSILVTLAVVPISLSSRPAPTFVRPERVAIKELFRTSPLGIAGVGFSGLASSALFAIGPVYAAASGMSVAQIASFMAVFMIGGVMGQAPIGWLSDKIDRRKVLIGVAGIAGLCCILTGVVSAFSPNLVIVMMFFIGFFSLSIYGQSLSHTNDHLQAAQIVAVSATLILLNGGISVIGPFLVTGMMSSFGDIAFFPYVGVIYLALCLFGLYRARISPPVPMSEQGDFVVMQESSTPVIMQLAEDAPPDEESGKVAAQG